MSKKNGDEKLAFFLAGVFGLLALCGMGYAGKEIWNSRPYEVPAGYKLVPIKAEAKKKPAQAEKLTYDLGEMFIKGPGTAAPGKATVVAKNVGAAPHELVILKTDKPAGSLGSGATAAETGKVGEIANVGAGQAKQTKVKLETGHYALICNVPGHYAAGMHADLNVK